MFFNQTLNGRIELGSYSVGKIRFFGVALDFAIEPVLFSPSPGNLFESLRGHPPVPLPGIVCVFGFFDKNWVSE